VVLHALFFLYLLFDKNLWKQGVAGLIIIALYTVYRIIVCKARNQKFYYGAGFFFPFIAFYNILWLVLLDGILGGLCIRATQKRSVYVSPYLIELKLYPHKRYKWNDLNNVILKDNILTLDFKNNKLMQAEIESANINEEAFNTFAKEQLLKIN
jgi:hypothetical protein